MKKWLLLGIALAIVASAGGYSAVKWKHSVDAPHYGFDEQLNPSKTGSAVCWAMLTQDEWYLFIRDFRKSASKPQFLCHMNYTSTQGSYRARWSKDSQMIAVYDESALRFPETKSPQWVIGYDWQRSQILHSKEIIPAFQAHRGFGAWYEYTSLRAPTRQETEQFEPQKLNRDRAKP